MKAVCPGSFDPVTYGHLDVIGRAAGLFDEVVVAVGRNSAKKYLFDTDERVAMLRAVLADHPHVSVTAMDGLLVDFCRAQGAGVIVKGLRFASDFEYELQMAHMNNALTGIETILLPTSSRWASLSSTVVREVAHLGGDVSAFVPPAVNAQIVQRREA